MLAALALTNPVIHAENVIVKDSFTNNDFTRKTGDKLHGTPPEQAPPASFTNAVWNVTAARNATVFSSNGSVITDADRSTSEARIALPSPSSIITVSARVIPTSSDWVAVGFLATATPPPATTASNWLAKDHTGALIWIYLRPGGSWALFANGTQKQLLVGTPASYPSILFKPDAPLTIGVSYDPANRRARPFIRDDESGVEANLFSRDNGWIDTRLPADVKIGAAGFRINSTTTSIAGKASVDDFLVTEAGAGVLRFTQLPPDIRKQILPGTPRSSDRIDASPFGIHTTIMNEGGTPQFVEKMVSLISDAGFKWAVDYLAHARTDGMTPEQVAQKYATLPERCTDYARRLQSAKVNLLVRLDPFPWTPHGKEAAYDYTPGSQDMKKASAFTRAVIRQLKPYTRHWQIWNEPNLGNATPYITPENYVKLFSQIATVIRSEQPDAILYGPGTAMLQCLADRPYPWIPRALAAGLLDHVEVFTFHPYRQPAVRENIPEHASEFAPWQIWKTYENQIADLRTKMRAHVKPGRELPPLAATEDGLPDLINGAGEQQISWIVAAKYELRRALLDFRLGINPRTLFCLYRPITDPFYNEQSSYSIVTADYQKKPAYNAAQNLHAILDSSYTRADNIPVSITPVVSASRVANAAAPRGPIQIHSYRKDHGAFEELLVFYWSAESGSDTHPRYPAILRIDEPGWLAPLKIDLMSMPVRRPAKAPIEIIDSRFVDRRDPEPLAAHFTGNDTGGVTIDPIDVRDYPLLIKWVRLK